MELRTIAVRLFLAATAQPAFAGNLYLLGAAGQSHFDVAHDTIDNALTRAGAIGLRSSTKANDTAYKVQLGYRFTPNFAIEGGYVDLGKAKYAASFFGGTATASIKAHGVNVAALGILPVNEALSLFGKLGVIDARAETELHTTRFAASVSSTVLRADTGLGASYDFNKNVGARLEYEQFHKLGDVHGGTRKVGLWSLGISVSF